MPVVPVAQFVEMLPEYEQLFALKFVKRLVLAWDPDFTKVTAREAARAEVFICMRGKYYL